MRSIEVLDQTGRYGERGPFSDLLLSDVIANLESNPRADAAIFLSEIATSNQIRSMKCFKPFVIVSSDINPKDFQTMPCVVLHQSAARGGEVAFHKHDRKTLDRYFKFKDKKIFTSYGVSTVFSLALWLACFRARNIMRLNRAALYWQRDLSLKHRIYTLGDYLSKMKGGMSIGEALRSPFSFQFQEPIFYPDDGGDDKSSNNGIGVVSAALREFRGPILLQPYIFWEMTDRRGNGMQSQLAAALRRFPDSLVILLNPTDGELYQYHDMSNVLCLDSDDLALSTKELIQRIRDYLSVNLVCNSSMSIDILDEEELERTRDWLRSHMTQPFGFLLDDLPTGVYAATKGGAAEELQIHGSIEKEEKLGGRLILDSEEESFGVPSADPTQIKDINAPEWSVMGANAWKSEKLGRTFNPLFWMDVQQRVPRVDLSILDALEVQDKTQRLQAVSRAVSQVNAEVSMDITQKIFQGYQRSQEYSMFRFHHYQFVLPMVRDTSLQSLLASVISASRASLNDASGRALLRVLSSGVLSANRSGAWALGAVLSQLSPGGYGTLGLPIWDSNPGVSEVGSSDTGQADNAAQKVLEINLTKPEGSAGSSTDSAKHFVDSFAHPVERHLRLQELLGERRAPGINPRITTYISTLTSTLSKNDITAVI